MKPKVEAYMAAEGWVVFVGNRKWPGVYASQDVAIRSGALPRERAAELAARFPTRAIEGAELDEAAGAMQVWDRLTRSGP